MKAFFAFFLCLVCGLCSAAEQDFCNWDHPGVNKYQQLPVKALQDYYMDYRIRATLQVKMNQHWYDDIVEIRRDGVKGSDGWSYSNMRDMHYGKNGYCPGPVDAGAWPASRVERGLVYCVAEVCVVVPTICNNVSLIDRTKAGGEAPIDIEPAAGPLPPSVPGGAPQPSVDQGPGQPGPVLGPDVAEGMPMAPVPSSGNYSGWWDGGGGGLVGPGQPDRGNNPGAPICPSLAPGCDLNPPPPICPTLGCVNPPIPPAVPEPSEWTMMGLGLVCFIWLWEKRDKRK